MKLLIIFIFFLLLGALVVIENNDLALYKQGNLSVLSEKYISWLDLIYGNIQILVKDIAGREWFFKKDN